LINLESLKKIPGLVTKSDTEILEPLDVFNFADFTEPDYKNEDQKDIKVKSDEDSSSLEDATDKRYAEFNKMMEFESVLRSV
jgi:hypothetical protein